MVVYIEYVIVDNFTLDLLLAYLCRTLLREKPTWWRLLFSAVVGTALVFPFLYIRPTWARLLYKVAVLVACCLPLSDCARLLRKNLVLYAVLSAVFGGLYYIMAGAQLTPRAGVVTTTGGQVAAVAGSVLLGLYVIRQVRGLVREIKVKRHTVKVQLVNGERFIFVKGYYDTGNTVVATDGHGVVFLSPRLAAHIGDMHRVDHIEVRTIMGKNAFDLYLIDCVKIYCEGRVNTINHVHVAYSRDNLSGCDALLPCNW